MKISIKSILFLLVLSVMLLIGFVSYEDYQDDKFEKNKRALLKSMELASSTSGESNTDDSNAEFNNNFTTILEKVTEKPDTKEIVPVAEKKDEQHQAVQKIDVLEASDKDLSFPQMKLTDLEPKAYYKESIVYNNRTILYIGAEYKIEAVKRVIDIAANLDNAINKGMRRNKGKISSSIEERGDDLVIEVNGNEILKVKDIDAKINNQSKERLARIWKENIDSVILDYIKYKRPQTFSDNIIYIAINLTIFLLIAGIFEFIKLLSDRFMNLFVTRVVKACNKMLKRFKKNETPQEIAAFEEESKEKIELISKQACHVITVICRIMQAFLVFIFIIAMMYNIPETYHYIKGIAHYIISAILLYSNEYLYWLSSDTIWKHVFDTLLIIAVTIIVLYIIKILESIIINLIQVVMSDIKSKGKRFQTITKIISTTLKIVIVLFAGYAIINSLNINMAPILAGAGIASIALSFAGQNLLKDVINGIFILMEDHFGIGDIIKVDDKSGTVEDMTLRITVLRDLSGIVHIIPNSQINFVSVYTKDWARANLDISISYKDDIDQAIDVIYETANQLKKEFPEKVTGEAKVLGVNKLDNSSVDIKFIIETAPGDQWFTEREFRKRIKYAFDKNNIVIPFPHMTIYEGCKLTNEARFDDLETTPE